MSEPKKPLDWFPQFDPADKVPHPIQEAHKQAFLRLYELRDYLNMAQTSSNTRMASLESTAEANRSDLQRQNDDLRASLDELTARIGEIIEFVGMP